MRQSTRTPREDRARRIHLYERFKIVYFLLSFSLYLTLCISITISQSPTVSKENAKDSSFVLTQTHAHTQHHDAAIWSHVSLSVKWSLLFRYCAVQHSSVVWLCVAECVRICVYLSLSTCWTGSTNYTYYCQRVSVKQGVSSKPKRKSEWKTTNSRDFSKSI